MYTVKTDVGKRAFALRHWTTQIEDSKWLFLLANTCWHWHCQITTNNNSNVLIRPIALLQWSRFGWRFAANPTGELTTLLSPPPHSHLIDAFCVSVSDFGTFDASLLWHPTIYCKFAPWNPVGAHVWTRTDRDSQISHHVNSGAQNRSAIIAAVICQRYWIQCIVHACLCVSTMRLTANSHLFRCSSY